MEPMTAPRQLKYSPSKAVDVSTMLPIGSVANLGATILDGEPEAWVRFDLTMGKVNAGLFMATPGKLRYTFPSTEHATILEGSATFTDEEGHSQTYGPGDSYVIAQGTVMICECSERMIKSFLNVVEG